MIKLAQGARDLHSGRSQVDFAGLAEALGLSDLKYMNTALQAYDLAGEKLADWVARESREKVLEMLPEGVAVDTVVIDRAGTVLARAGGV